MELSKALQRRSQELILGPSQPSTDGPALALERQNNSNLTAADQSRYWAESQHAFRSMATYSEPAKLF